LGLFLLLTTQRYDDLMQSDHRDSYYVDAEIGHDPDGDWAVSNVSFIHDSVKDTLSKWDHSQHRDRRDRGRP
jgi:hypothetical protein